MTVPVNSTEAPQRQDGTVCTEEQAGKLEGNGKLEDEGGRAGLIPATQVGGEWA